jgi:hypothetical protein
MARRMCGALALVCILLISGCIGQNPSGAMTNIDINNASGNISDVQKIEVLHFHGTHQCYSCITVGDYAEETVNTYFSEELKSGKIVFAHINGELPENNDMVTKYGATGSSLWIGVYDKNGFHKEENTRVWYKISDKGEYMNYLAGIIEKRLNGDMK